MMVMAIIIFALMVMAIICKVMVVMSDLDIYLPILNIILIPHKVMQFQKILKKS